MNPWNKYTLFRLTVFFATGIIVSYNFDNKLHIPVWLILSLAASIFLFQVSASKNFAYRYRWVVGILLSALMVGMGAEWSRLHDQRNQQNHLSHLYHDKLPVIVRISGPVESRPNSFKALAQALAIENDSIWVKTSGKVLLYFAKDSLSEKISYGDRLVIYSGLNAPQPPANPSEFDYRQFLANKNIFYQSFVRQGDWATIGRGEGNPVVNVALQLRNTFIRVFDQHGIIGRDFAVATALVLGMSDYLDNDTRSQFSAAGAMHVLCVSGLHVGVIFLVMSSMLAFLNRNKYTRLLRALLLLGGIWFYALLTGLAPSVLRASTMFSFVIVGMSMSRRADIYNSLAASAFVLLLFNPFLIHEVGFQLSYAAVIAIVSIQPRIYSLWKPRYWLPEKVWAITTVSIAAQLGTAPLGLYYFHQFPNYFIITNLIVIPLATFILYSGFLTVILSPLPVVSGWVAWFLVKLLKTMNASVTFIDGLPYSATTGVFISLAEMLILFLVLLAGFRALSLRKAVLIQFSLLFLLLFFGLGIIRQHQLAHQKKLVVYALRNNVAIDLIHGRNGLMLVDSTIMADPGLIEFQVSGNRIRSGISRSEMCSHISLTAEDSLRCQPQGLPFRLAYPFMQFAGQIVVFADRNVLPDEENPVQVNMIVVIENHRNPSAVLKGFQAEMVVVGGNVSPWNAGLWRETCHDSGIHCHVIREEGAFVWDL